MGTQTPGSNSARVINPGIGTTSGEHLDYPTPVEKGVVYNSPDTIYDLNTLDPITDPTDERMYINGPTQLWSVDALGFEGLGKIFKIPELVYWDSVDKRYIDSEYDWVWVEYNGNDYVDLVDMIGITSLGNEVAISFINTNTAACTNPFAPNCKSPTDGAPNAQINCLVTRKDRNGDEVDTTTYTILLTVFRRGNYIP